ncbi:MAG TPA: RNA pyrophosphohydrolase [Sphingomicrobium sp.]|nr:RNA pyrophosphohydrolase [Sphingomicrobium sp.]
MSEDDHLYRLGVGVMLLNREGKVFVGARIDNPEDAWQMPQGGLEQDEQPWPCALRELQEETGINPALVEMIAEHPQLLRYELPEEWRGKLWGGRWIGQSQHWFLARFLGVDKDIDLATEHPEFRDWRWVDSSRLPDLIVPFKRDLYRRLVEDFATYL